MCIAGIYKCFCIGFEWDPVWYYVFLSFYMKPYIQDLPWLNLLLHIHLLLHLPHNTHIPA